jgi:hypothetical protein
MRGALFSLSRNLHGVQSFSERKVVTQSFSCVAFVAKQASQLSYVGFGLYFFFVGWDLRHQVLRPLLAYCTAPDDR